MTWRVVYDRDTCKWVGFVTDDLNGTYAVVSCATREAAHAHMMRDYAPYGTEVIVSE